MCSESPRSIPHAFVIALLGVSLLLGACGKKGDPLPPLRYTPIAASDLTVRQEGGMLLLELAYPATTESGQPLGGIDRLELWSYDRPLIDTEEALPQVQSAEFNASAQQLVALSGAELESAVVGNRLQLRIPIADPLPAGRSASVFAVRTGRGTELSMYSNLAALLVGAAPEAPTGLDLEATRRGVIVRWEADEDPLNFDIFRRLASERGYGERLRRAPGDRRQIIDGTASYGQRYIYTVRAVGTVEPLVLSDPAGEREIEYVDRFAPPLPSNFVALAERAAVRLRWEASDADDVAGYVLYRSEPGRTQSLRLNERLETSEEFLDTGLASGVTFAYQIQAIDREGNESPLSPPVTATPR